MLIKYVTFKVICMPAHCKKKKTKINNHYLQSKLEIKPQGI